jgi:CRP-like cAMP-binding protein
MLTHTLDVSDLFVCKALEFCERSLIRKVTHHTPHSRMSCLRIDYGEEDFTSETTVQSLMKNILGRDFEDDMILREITNYCEEVKYMAGEAIFKMNTHSDAFYMVISGKVAVPKQLQSTKIISGAGVKKGRNLSSSNLMEFMAEGHDKKDATATVESFHKVGNVFGYCDFLLERYRTFDAVAKDGTVLAKFTRADVDRMKVENRQLYGTVQNVLLKASLMDLANCTCHA